MAVTYVNEGSQSQGGIGSHTPGAPASIVVGNLLVCVAIGDTTSTPAASALTCSTSGWAEHPDICDGVASVLKLFWKVAESTSETMPTVSFADTSGTGEVSLARVFQFTGDFDPLDPFGTSGTEFGSATASTTVGPITSPGTIASGHLAVAVGGRGEDHISSTYTASSPWTHRVDYWTQTGGDVAAMLATFNGDDSDPGSCSFTVATGTPPTSTRVGRIYVIEAAPGLVEPVGQATETDTAQIVSPVRDRPVGQAVETDTAQTITPILPVTPVGQAIETDTALSIWPGMRIAVETDTAQVIRPVRTYLVGQALETDTATPVIRSHVIGQAIETDTAGAVTWAPKIRLLQIAVETSTAHALEQFLEPDFLDASASLVFWPELSDKNLYPDRVDNPAATVYSPALSSGQSLQPDLLTNSSTVFSPALVAGQALVVDDIIVVPILGTVFSPALIQAPDLLQPDLLTNTSTVFSPALIQAQVLQPDFWTNPTPVVYDPANLILGQSLAPDFWTNPAPTIYSPALAQGQPLSPDTIAATGPTLYSPALAISQTLYPGTIAAGTITVYEPELALVEDPVIVVDPVSDYAPRTAVRSGR